MAGGIGITPFIARMQTMAHQPKGRDIDLFYSTSAPDEPFLRKVRLLAEQAQIRLHITLAGKDPRLTCDGICALVSGWKDASVWFCGPAGFGKAVRQGFAEQGLPADHFHQELFDMR